MSRLLGWSTPAVVLACAAATQTFAAPCIGAEPAGRGDMEPLLSYRRDDQALARGNDSADAPPAPPRYGSPPGSDGNRLRTDFAEPPADYAPAAAAGSAAPVQAAMAAEHAEPIAAADFAPLRYDQAVSPATHVAADATIAPTPRETTPAAPASASLPSSLAPNDSNASRRLAPRNSASVAAPSGQTAASLPLGFSTLNSLSTAGAGLAVVVGLFLLCMWLLRRSGGGKASGLLPSEAFAVLGRAPLTAQSFAHLLRVGNKLVLVAVSADGIQPLTEVVDPIEVDRLASLCASGRGYGPVAEFQQALAQLSREPARGFLGAEAAAGGRRHG